ncbi:glycerophosphodiester phosphodiesterase family protein [Yersinia pekkanenii]|uniref:Glycerophosphoryl diester phosphodiesterase n=1 Tax=Yersinia pekkanenii TaxID=1288385 RepID=A0A0T9Q4E5_9GAMM|nr:glycerophosphodiester phosphodiesterase family protein [Yersinia pekkanenii]CNH95773.1 glycerophosphoryl diester phosphodiesterase [Yersinia pekkanenii]CRY64461.1 glycerophosphoryl diester phosphodiesterase [Yersinia pekkanenii]
MKKTKFITLLFSLVFTLPTLASPLIVAHRAGTADYPENTRYAIDMALKNEADIIWLSIQFSKDGIPVLYRPSDLQSLTNASEPGPVSAYTWEELRLLDAAYYFNTDGQYTYRGRGVKIPSLLQIITSYPKVNFILDIKSPDTDPLTMANTLDRLISETNSFDRVRFYSTEKRYLDALPDYINKFEPRNLTRKILANSVMANNCKVAKKRGAKLINSSDKYHAFELRRDVKVVEKLTLSRGVSRAQLVWNQQAMACFKKNNDTKILLIGVNSYEDYQLAENLGADYIMVDSPATARYWR